MFAKKETRKINNNISHFSPHLPRKALQGCEQILSRLRKQRRKIMPFRLIERSLTLLAVVTFLIPLNISTSSISDKFWKRMEERTEKLGNRRQRKITKFIFITILISLNFDSMNKSYYVMELISNTVEDIFVLIPTTSWVINPRDPMKEKKFSNFLLQILSWKLISMIFFFFILYYFFFLALAPMKDEWNWLNQFLCGIHACSRNSENFAAIPFYFFFLCQWSIKCLWYRKKNLESYGMNKLRQI